MCSTPQKQPAAMVAFAEPSGLEMGPTGVMERELLELKGRRRREMNEGMVVAIRMVMARKRSAFLAEV
jgi:hypothetical protein